MIRIVLVALVFVFVSDSFVSDAAWAQAKRALNATEMQALLAKGLSVESTDLEGGKKFTGQVNLQMGGKLTGTLNVVGHGAAPLDGKWQLKGAQLCRTLGDIQPEEVCETWLRAGSGKEVTVQVAGKDVSVNRWK